MNTNTESIDDRYNDEADRHAQMMRKQREGWDGKQIGTIGATNSGKSAAIYCSVVPLLWRKTGTEYEK